MPITALQMHEQFLEQVRADISERERELTELRAVEHYHAAIVARKESRVRNRLPQSTAESTDSAPGPLDPKIRKHDAIRQALIALGGSATTLEICNWLKARKYTEGQKQNVFYNGIFTTLKRGTDDFQRNVATKKWTLIGKVEPDTESQNKKPRNLLGQAAG